VILYRPPKTRQGEPDSLVAGVGINQSLLKVASIGQFIPFPASGFPAFFAVM
jgi:hypothetical protein